MIIRKIVEKRKKKKKRKEKEKKKYGFDRIDQ